MSFFDIVLDFILMDAFEDLENPPSSVLAVLRNRWLSDSFKETVSAPRAPGELLGGLPWRGKRGLGWLLLPQQTRVQLAELCCSPAPAVDRGLVASTGQGGWGHLLELSAARGVWQLCHCQPSEPLWLIWSG